MQESEQQQANPGGSPPNIASATTCSATAQPAADGPSSATSIATPTTATSTPAPNAPSTSPSSRTRALSPTSSPKPSRRWPGAPCPPPTATPFSPPAAWSRTTSPPVSKPPNSGSKCAALVFPNTKSSTSQPRSAVLSTRSLFQVRTSIGPPPTPSRSRPKTSASATSRRTGTRACSAPKMRWATCTSSVSANPRKTSRPPAPLPSSTSPRRTAKSSEPKPWPKPKPRPVHQPANPRGIHRHTLVTESITSRGMHPPQIAFSKGTKRRRTSPPISTPGPKLPAPG